MVAMKESGLQRNARSQQRGGRSDRAAGDDVLSEVRELKDKAAEVAQLISSGAKAAREQVMQKAAEVTRAVADGVKEEAERIFDDQKERIGSRVDRWGKAIHQGAHALRAVKADGVADVVDQAAEKVGGVSSYLEERDLGDLLEDAEEVARRNPAVVVGTLFVAGLLAALFVKASASRGESGARGASGRTTNTGGARKGR